MKVILFLIILNMNFLIASEQEELAFQKKVTAILIKNPNALDTIIQAGNYFYQRKKWAKAIYYFIAPNLIKHPQYINARILQAKSHYNLRQYKYSYDVLKYLLTLRPKKKKRNKIIKLLKKVKRVYTPPKKIIKDYTYSQFSLYYAKLNYSSDADKDSAGLFGGYFLYTRNDLTLELGYESFALSFNTSTSISDYSQSDMVVAISGFDISYQHKLRFLYHQATAGSNNAFSSKSVLASYDYYFLNKINIASEFSYQVFTGNTYSSDTNAYQMTPKFALPLGRSFYAILKYNYSKNNYSGNTYVGTTGSSSKSTSSEIMLSYYAKYLSLDLSYMSGEEQFMLKDFGVVIQNSSDVTKSKIQLGTTFNLSKKLTISFKYAKSNYIQEGSTQEFQSKAISSFLNFYF